jgi:hypothetical protein
MKELLGAKELPIARFTSGTTITAVPFFSKAEIEAQVLQKGALFFLWKKYVLLAHLHSWFVNTINGTLCRDNLFRRPFSCVIFGEEN